MRSLSGIGAVWDWRVSKGLLFYWDDQNISSVFSISFLCCASLSLTSFKIILLDCIVTIQDGRKQQHFWYIMLYYFKKGKNGTKMQKKKTKNRKKMVVLLIGSPLKHASLSVFHRGHIASFVPHILPLDSGNPGHLCCGSFGWAWE